MDRSEPEPRSRRQPRQFALSGLVGLVSICAVYLSALILLPQFFGSGRPGLRVFASCFAVWLILALVYLKRPSMAVLAIHWLVPATTAVLMALAFTAGMGMERCLSWLAEGCLTATLLSCPVFVFQILLSGPGRSRR